MAAPFLTSADTKQSLTSGIPDRNAFPSEEAEWVGTFQMSAERSRGRGSSPGLRAESSGRALWLLDEKLCNGQGCLGGKQRGRRRPEGTLSGRHWSEGHFPDSSFGSGFPSWGGGPFSTQQEGSLGVSALERGAQRPLVWKLWTWGLTVLVCRPRREPGPHWRLRAGGREQCAADQGSGQRSTAAAVKDTSQPAHGSLGSVPVRSDGDRWARSAVSGNDSR